jgi:hypothetical protein
MADDCLIEYVVADEKNRTRLTERQRPPLPVVRFKLGNVQIEFYVIDIDQGFLSLRLCLKSLKMPVLIHTGLQPGDQRAEKRRNRLERFSQFSRTGDHRAEAGVNEICSRSAFEAKPFLTELSSCTSFESCQSPGQGLAAERSLVIIAGIS